MAEGAEIAPAPRDPLDWLPASVAARATQRDLSAGQALFRQGDKTVALFAVRKGRIRLLRHSDASQPAVIHTARAGELFAEAALFADRYQCDAVAATEASVRIYPRPVLLAEFRRDPDLALRFMAVLAQQVRGLRARLEERNIRSARERVLRHVALAAGADGCTMRLDGTLIDLAGEIGLSHESLYRTLAALEQSGEIERTPAAIVLRKSPDI